jgi:hypothetical protein
MRTSLLYNYKYDASGLAPSLADATYSLTNMLCPEICLHKQQNTVMHLHVNLLPARNACKQFDRHFQMPNHLLPASSRSITDTRLVSGVHR